MKFSEEQTHKVTLHHRDLGDLGEAQLKFGGEWGAVATMGFLTSVPRLDPARPLDFVTAKTEDGHTFTLCECRYHAYSLIVTFVVQGAVTGHRFLRFDVRYSDISEWFLRPDRVDGTVGEQLTWVRRSEHFSEAVIDNARRFTVSSNYAGSYEHVGEDLIVNEYE